MLRSPDYKGVNVVEEDGAEIYRLISGDPNIYEGGWDTPRHMKDAVIKAIEDGYNMYPNRIEGLDARLTESILGWERRVNGVHYAPEDIIGRKACFVVNLAPIKLRGIESQGMILMAENAAGELCFVEPSEAFDSGSEVK